MSKHGFQTEVSKLLNLMIHSLYSNKEIFLRELISNASDALDKLNFLTLTKDEYKSLNYSPKIVIEIDEKSKTISIGDNGIGMNEEDLVENLGTIAKSGTKSFVENLSGDAKKDSSLIGQFGVGFYSVFMVAKKASVLSKKALEEKGYLWESEAKDDYEIKEAPKGSFGTTVTLEIKDEDDEFLGEWRIKEIVKKYSNHIPFPIFLKTGEKEEQINKASALWRVPKNEIKEDEYKDFYKQISHDSIDPFLWIHTKAEGTIEYATLFYVPQKAPFDMYRMDYAAGVKLYVKRVFITDEDKELMPTYLRFVKGIVDVEDLPLNVSREILQQNKILSKVKQSSVKKILGELKKLKEENRAKYEEFFGIFGKVLKEGLYGEFENKEDLLELMLFKSNLRDGLVSFGEYKEKMKEEQKEIYYLVGQNGAVLKNSPLIEDLTQREIEVLLMDDEIDAIVAPMVHEYDTTPLQSAAAKNKNDKTNAEDEEKIKEITDKLKEILKDEIKDVKSSSRLKNSAACLVNDEEDPEFMMGKIMKQMGQMAPAVKPILELNPNHEIFSKILSSGDFSNLEDIGFLLLDGAKLQAGLTVENPNDFAARLSKIIAKSI